MLGQATQALGAIAVIIGEQDFQGVDNRPWQMAVTIPVSPERNQQ
jgi:hypothetical protein